MFKCGLCKKNFGKNVSSRVVELERRQVVYKTWNGKEVYGHETSRSTIACIGCSNIITPEIAKNPKVVEFSSVFVPKYKPNDFSTETDGKPNEGRARKFKDSRRHEHDDESY